MFTFFTKTSIGIFIIFASLILFISGCSDSTNPDPDPPIIPPQATLLMDFSDFNTGSTPKLSSDLFAKNTSVLTQDNWGHAAINVWFWSLYTNTILLIPAAIFGSTINQDAQYQGDFEWMWTNTFPTINPQYTSKLYGKIVGDVVQWRMYISQTDVYTDFLWFTGESNLNATGGNWTFKKSAEDPVNVLEITWNRTGDEVGDLKYEGIESGSVDEGSYIFWELTDDATYDAAFELFSNQTQNTINVEWHRVNQNGRVMDPAYYSDNSWHCWNENHDDITCP